MDPGHHTAYLLAILICILLLLLAVSAILLCYFRRNGFNIPNRKSAKRLETALRDQSTSMTSFASNFMDPKLSIDGDLNYPRKMSLPLTVDKSKQPTSPLSLDGYILCISNDEESAQTSRLEGKSVRKKSETLGRYSALKYMLSSGASFLGSVLEKSSMFSLKGKRRSSSLKSGINSDILMVPLESPVHVSSMTTGAYQAVSIPINLSRKSTLLCENSSEQQFTWDTSDLSTHSDHLTLKGNSFVRKSPIPEEGAVKQAPVQLRNPDFLQPKAWFVSFRNRPVSDGVQLEKKELNNVASLDSGVDTMDVLLRLGSGGLSVMPKVLPTLETEIQVPIISSQGHLKSSSVGEEKQEVEEAQEGCNKLYITHQQAARKLNPGSSGRTLWEKREERPLLGFN
ncbi:uncharacterized protein LOC143818484 [Ranitomeya variabilis]|uniref:uncharacterized protein LOC143818484 n=1 Tax=Ranitomeya variabilis TaxID=490064 RepID=UPI0040564C76